MGKLVSLLQRDLILGIKDVFVLMEIGFAVLVTAVLVFLVPDDITSDGVAFIHDQSGLLDSFLVEQVGEEELLERGEFLVDSRAELIAGLQDNRSAVGVAIGPRGADGRFPVEVLTQPYTTEAVVNYLETDLRDLIRVLSPQDRYAQEVFSAVRIEALAEGRRDEIPFNQLLVPSVIVMVVAIIGVFAMLGLIGQERADKTIRATRASPTGLGTVLASKHLLMLLVGTVTFSIIYLLTIGLGGFLPALLITWVTIVIGSSLGTLLGSFFEDAMAAVGLIFVLMIVLGLPAVSLFNPAFAPDWIRVIPTYHTFFALDAAMFPADNANLIWNGLIVLAGFAVVLVPGSGLLFVYRIRKES